MVLHRNAPFDVTPNRREHLRAAMLAFAILGLMAAASLVEMIRLWLGD